MIAIRLRVPLYFDHFEIPAGIVISVPAEIAETALRCKVAEAAEYRKAVQEPPQEMRAVVKRPLRPRT